MNDEILTLKEVAGYLKLAEKTAYRLAAEGKVQVYQQACRLDLVVHT